MNDLAAVCRRAEALLAGMYPVFTRLEVLEQFESGHTVLRCVVTEEDGGRQAGAGRPADPSGSPAGLPRTVIVKQRTLAQPGDSHEFDQTVLFCNEWASLDFLASLSGESPAPHLIASDRPAGLVVLEDLGSAQSVQDVLYGTDRQAAVDALAGMGRALGQIQRMTRGREAEFAQRQAALGASTTLCDASLDLRDRLPELNACRAALGLKDHERFDQAIVALESAIHGPGALRAFVHNDAGPHNFVVTGRGVQLLDYEFAGFGFGLVDVVCARLAFPPAYRGRVPPAEMARLLEESYRAELPEVLRDEQRFTEGMAQGCAHWAFSKLAGFWNGYLRERLLQGEAYDTRGGRRSARAAYFRQQVFTYLRLALAELEEQDPRPELRAALAPIVEQLLRIWPETPLLPGYPAFGGEPWQDP